MLVTVESAYAPSHLSVNVALSGTVSEIFQRRFLCSLPTHIIHPFWGCSGWTISPMLGSIWAVSASYLAVKLFSKYSKLLEKSTLKRHRQTDRETDRQTTYCGITALCIATRGKNRAWAAFIASCVGGLPQTNAYVKATCATISMTPPSRTRSIYYKIADDAVNSWRSLFRKRFEHYRRWSRESFRLFLIKL